jgi:hypothetical protein
MFPMKAFLLLASALTICAQAIATPVSSDEAKVGVVIDTGITMSGLGQKPFPLPPGQWRVVARVDYTLGLTGGSLDAGITGMPMVSLTLMNEEKAAPVAIMYINYPTNRVAVSWTNAPCQDDKAAAIETFGTTAGSMKYGCAKFYSHPSHDFRKFVGSTTLSSGVKDRWAALAQYPDFLPIGYDWTSFSINLEKGRKVDAVVITRPVAWEQQGKIPPSTLAFSKNVGEALLSWMSNDTAAIGAYPMQ